MKTLKKTVTAIGKAIFAILVPNVPDGKDLVARIYPRAAYGW